MERFITIASCVESLSSAAVRFNQCPTPRSFRISTRNMATTWCTSSTACLPLRFGISGGKGCCSRVIALARRSEERRVGKEGRQGKERDQGGGKKSIAIAVRAVSASSREV